MCRNRPPSPSSGPTRIVASDDGINWAGLWRSGSGLPGQYRGREGLDDGTRRSIVARSLRCWCQPRRLRNLLRHTTSIRFPGNIDRWAVTRRDLVEASMTRSTPEWPVPVGCLSVEYWPRRLPPLVRNWLERRGLHVLTIELATSFMDGMHRTAWLMARGAPFVPLMGTSICSAFALEAHAGAGICHIDLEKLQDSS